MNSTIDENEVKPREKIILGENIQSTNLSVTDELDSEKVSELVSKISSNPYLSFDEYFSRLTPEELTEIDRLCPKERLPINTQAIIVAPAHNENHKTDKNSNIRRFVRSVNAQKTENPFVTLIIDNNSDDGTGEAAIQERKTSNIEDLYVFSVEFPELRRGVGSARRLGANIAFRMAQLSGIKPEDIIIIGTDSDNELPNDIIDTLIKYSQKYEKYDYFGGRVITDYNEYARMTTDPNLIDIFREIDVIHQDIKLEQKQFREKIFGAYHAIRARELLRIGGYQPLRAGEDSFINYVVNKSRKKIIHVPVKLPINPRRSVLFPKGITRTIKEGRNEIETFDSSTEAVRDTSTLEKMSKEYYGMKRLLKSLSLACDEIVLCANKKEEVLTNIRICRSRLKNYIIKNQINIKLEKYLTPDSITIPTQLYKNDLTNLSESQYNKLNPVLVGEIAIPTFIEENGLRLFPYKMDRLEKEDMNINRISDDEMLQYNLKDLRGYKVVYLPILEDGYPDINYNC